MLSLSDEGWKQKLIIALRQCGKTELTNFYIKKKLMEILNLEPTKVYLIIEKDQEDWYGSETEIVGASLDEKVAQQLKVEYEEKLAGRKVAYIEACIKKTEQLEKQKQEIAAFLERNGEVVKTEDFPIEFYDPKDVLKERIKYIVNFYYHLFFNHQEKLSAFLNLDKLKEPLPTFTDEPIRGPADPTDMRYFIKEVTLS